MEEFRAEKLVVEYTQLYVDFKAAERKNTIIIIFIWLLPTLYLTAMFVLGLIFDTQKINFFSLSTISFLFFVLLILIAFYFSSPDMVWKQLVDTPKEKRIIIDNGGVLLETPYSHLQCPWHWIAMVHELKKHYLISTITRQAIIIPKNSLKREEELLLRELIQKNLPPKKIKLKKKKSK
ncbi:MAG: YcxB family protein [Candidatus Thorarchaeota archaeon]